MQNTIIFIVLSSFSFTLLTFLMLFILLACGEVELSGKAIGALAGVMVALIHLMTELVKRLSHQKRRQK